MEKILILCDGAQLPSFDEEKFTKCIEIQQGKSLRIEVENLSYSLLKSLQPLSRDLLEIASYVYHADGSIFRGSNKDVMDEKWSSNVKFIIPVRNPEVWNKPSIHDKLVELLDYLVEHKFDFLFIERKPVTEQLIISGLDKVPPSDDNPDCALLFSGGMDSLTGAVQLTRNNHRPILVSHKSNQVIAKRQKRLAQSLRNQRNLNEWTFPNIDLFINRIGEEAIEDSQRSRSFLFLAIGAIVSFELGIKELIVAENGITSFNFPRIGQPLGAQTSRTTHPMVIGLFEQLFNEIFTAKIHISLPFIWKTRADLLQLLKENNLERLVNLTVSCAHSRMTKSQPHCGVCSQCVDRRIAVTLVNLDTDEELLSYEKDMFISKLDDEMEFAQVASPFQFAAKIENMDEFTFQYEYGQIYDAVNFLPDEPEIILQKIFDLHKRYAKDIATVWGKINKEHYGKLARHELPDSCLLLRLPFMTHHNRLDILSRRASDLLVELNNCPSVEIKAYEEICYKIINFLFCENENNENILDKPEKQVTNDNGYKRRDVICQNHAKQGFWHEVYREYKGHIIVFDAKNYGKEIDGDPVREIGKYLQPNGLGMFGVLICRKLPDGAKRIIESNKKIPSAIVAQKELWSENRLILLIDDEDLSDMIKLKIAGDDPTKLLDMRIELLRKRV